MSRTADLTGYAEPGTAQMDWDTLHIAREWVAVAKLDDAPRSSATVGRPPAINDSGLPGVSEYMGTF